MEKEMELVISQPTQDLPTVKFNKEEIKQEISKRMIYYSTIVVNEETMKNSKTDLANLRKFKDGFEEKRKALKKRFLKPYEDFEKEYREIIELINQPINLINEQIQALELNQKEKKKEYIETFYKEVAKDILPIVPFDKVFKDKWLNKTASVKAIKDEILSFIVTFKTGYQTILNCDLKYKNQVIDKFIQTLDLPLALAENKRLSQQEKKVSVVEQTYKQEIKEKEQTENKIEELNKKFGNNVEESAQQFGPETDAPQTKPKKFVVTLQFNATIEQLKELKQFLTDRCIKFKKIGE